MLQEIETLDVIKETRRFFSLEKHKDQILHDKLKEIHMQEEVYWKQRSHIQ